jgi:hypothetical protein
LSAVKRNAAKVTLGRRRGVPIRLLRGIARKYALTHLVVYTLDGDKRARILYFAKNDQAADQCAQFSRELAKRLEWKNIWDWDCSSIRRLKSRVKELEAALAQIVDGEPDAVGLARAAGKFPDESEGEENLGAWFFFPQGKLNPAAIQK